MSPEKGTDPDKEQNELEEELDFEIKLGTRRDAASDDEGEEADGGEAGDALGSEEGEGFVTGKFRGSKKFHSLHSLSVWSLQLLPLQHLLCMCMWHASMGGYWKEAVIASKASIPLSISSLARHITNCTLQAGRLCSFYPPAPGCH
jgi:hypothetical protein